MATNKRKKSGSPGPGEENLLGSVAHTLGDAMVEAVGVAANTVTELVEDTEPKKQSRPKSGSKAKSKTKTKAKTKSAKSTRRTSAQSKRSKSPAARKISRKKRAK